METKTNTQFLKAYINVQKQHHGMVAKLYEESKDEWGTKPHEIILAKELVVLLEDIDISVDKPIKEYHEEFIKKEAELKASLHAQRYSTHVVSSIQVEIQLYQGLNGCINEQLVLDQLKNI